VWLTRWLREIIISCLRNLFDMNSAYVHYTCERLCLPEKNGLIEKCNLSADLMAPLKCSGTPVMEIYRPAGCEFFPGEHTFTIYTSYIFSQPFSCRTTWFLSLSTMHKSCWFYLWCGARCNSCLQRLLLCSALFANLGLEYDVIMGDILFIFEGYIFFKVQIN
jgi:hypothetical protein